MVSYKTPESGEAGKSAWKNYSQTRRKVEEAKKACKEAKADYLDSFNKRIINPLKEWLVEHPVPKRIEINNKDWYSAFYYEVDRKGERLGILVGTYSYYINKGHLEANIVIINNPEVDHDKIKEIDPDNIAADNRVSLESVVKGSSFTCYSLHLTESSFSFGQNGDKFLGSKQVLGFGPSSAKKSIEYEPEEGIAKINNERYLDDSLDDPLEDAERDLSIVSSLEAGDQVSEIRFQPVYLGNERSWSGFDGFAVAAEIMA